MLLTYCKAARTLFQGRHSPSSVRGQWDRSQKTFGWLLEFEKFTGGNGDGDLSAEEKIKLCRKQGHQIGSLNVKAIEEWTVYGWRDLWFER